jgi:hypothetical protein
MSEYGLFLETHPLLFSVDGSSLYTGAKCDLIDFWLLADAAAETD